MWEFFGVSVFYEASGKLMTGHSVTAFCSILPGWLCWTRFVCESIRFLWWCFWATRFGFSWACLWWASLNSIPSSELRVVLDGRPIAGCHLVPLRPESDHRQVHGETPAHLRLPNLGESFFILQKKRLRNFESWIYTQWVVLVKPHLTRKLVEKLTSKASLLWMLLLNY